MKVEKKSRIALSDECTSARPTKVYDIVLCSCFPCHKLVPKLHSNLHQIYMKGSVNCTFFNVNLGSILAPICDEEKCKLAH